MLCVAGGIGSYLQAGPEFESSFAYWAQLSRSYYFDLKTGTDTFHEMQSFIYFLLLLKC
jgi:hypothetical protein